MDVNLDGNKQLNVIWVGSILSLTYPFRRFYDSFSKKQIACHTLGGTIIIDKLS